MSIGASTAMGRVTLTVRDVDLVSGFYERVLGLDRLDGASGVVRLGVDGRPLVELVGDPDATPRKPRTTGLYHLAILVPDRVELARSLRRVVEARRRLAGASDHLVSEALYLDDPEGNGIEIYRDRPRAEWRRDGDEIAMATLPLDLRDLMAEPGHEEPVPHLARGARIGHVHLQVADLREAERFYGDLLGFDVTARAYPGALFVAAGGYHHHIGLNTWTTAGAPRPAAGSAGLRSFEVVLESRAALDATVARLDEAGVAVVDYRDGTALVRDPSQNAVALTSESQSTRRRRGPQRRVHQ